MQSDPSASHSSREPGLINLHVVRPTDKDNNSHNEPGTTRQRTHDDQRASDSNERRNNSSRRHRHGDEGRKQHHGHNSHNQARHVGNHRDVDMSRGASDGSGGNAGNFSHGRLERGSSSGVGGTSHSNGGKLFDPRKDDPVRFAALRKGMGIATSFDSTGAGSVSMNSQSDGRSVASSATPSFTTVSTASSEGRERTRRRRGGPGSRTTIESGETGSSRRKGHTDGTGVDGTKSENNSYVIELKRRYRDVAMLEAKLQAVHKAANEEQRKQQPHLNGASSSHMAFSLRHAVGEGHGAKSDGTLDHAYWLDLIAQHRSLAEAHAVFMEAALLPGLPASLHSLPQTYKIPARLWHTGFHTLLERFRAALPDFQLLREMLEHGAPPDLRQQFGEILDLMTDFIYFAYAFYSNLLESELFKVFRISWIENLGDIARYRMIVAKIAHCVGIHDGVRIGAQRRDSGSNAQLSASAIRSARTEGHQKEEAKSRSNEEDDKEDEAEVEKVSARIGKDQASIGVAAAQTWELEDKEIWRCTAREWYAKGLAEVPGTGRLHHHLAILSRVDDQLRSLYHFCKSLTTSHPYSCAREWMLPLFDRSAQSRRIADDADIVDLFVYLHGILFTKVQMDDFDQVLQRFNAKLQAMLSHYAEFEAKRNALPCSAWMMMATINIAAVFQYGGDNSQSALNGTEAEDGQASTSASKKSASTVAPSQSVPNVEEDDSDVAAGDIEEDDDGDDENDLGLPLKGARTDEQDKAVSTLPEQEGSQRSADPSLPCPIAKALQLTFGMLEILMRHLLADRKTLSANPYITIVLTFFSQECKQEGVLQRMERYVPWEQLIALGNAVPPNVEPIDPRHDLSMKIRSDAIPLPEDWCLRGMSWVGRKVYERGFWKPHRVERLGLRNTLLLFESEMDMLERSGARYWEKDIASNGRGDELISSTEEDGEEDDDDDDDDDDEGAHAAQPLTHGIVHQPRLTLCTLRWKRIVHSLTILIKLVPGLDFDIDGNHVHARHGRLVVAPPLEQKMVNWQAEATRLEVERAIGRVKLAALEGEEDVRASEQSSKDVGEGDEGQTVDDDDDEEELYTNEVHMPRAKENDTIDVQQLIRRREELRKQLRDAKSVNPPRSAGAKVAGNGEWSNEHHNIAKKTPSKYAQQKRPAEQRGKLRMVPGYTTLVLDTNVMLTPTDILEQLAASGQWLIIVPLPVVTELDGLKRRTDDVGRRASKALDSIESRIKTKHVRVQTSRGNYLPDLRFRNEDIQFGATEVHRGFFAPSPWPSTAMSASSNAQGGAMPDVHETDPNDSATPAARSVDDVILRCVAWQAGSHWRNRLILFSKDDTDLAHRQAQVAQRASLPPVALAVLITLDRNLRVKARFRNLHCIGPADLIDLLLESSTSATPVISSSDAPLASNTVPDRK